MLGLSRAFLVAGARSVLVSLWRVSDVAAQFQMEHFYAALEQNGGDRAELESIAALRGGVLGSDSGPRLAATPANWAPFVLVGEPR